MKLTEKIIAGLTCNAGQKDRLVFDDTVKGLGLRISSKGSKIFLVQFRNISGNKRRIPLGTWGSITLEQGRQAARSALGQVATGQDPFSDRKVAKEKALKETEWEKFTISALLSDWRSIGLAGNKESYRKEAVRAFSLAFAPYLKRRADALQRADVVKVLDRLVKAGKGPTANRTYAYGRACYSWAVKRGRLDKNPFEGIPTPAANESRDRVLNDDEIGAITRGLDKLGYPFGPLIKLLLFTAQRRDEVASLRWREISADLTTWTQPSEKTKNKKGHIVHLAPEARELLSSLARRTDTDLVFSTNGKTAVSGFSKAKARLDELIATGEPNTEITNWRLHDFRRTCVTWLAGAGFNPAVADKILNHTTATGITTVGKVYQRAEYLKERKQALDAWSGYVSMCSTTVVQSQNVITLERGGRDERKIKR